MWGVDMDVAAFISRGDMVRYHGIFNYGPGKNSGFTLLELLIAVVVFCCHIGYWCPFFSTISGFK
jgi:prepilin-type N-terminal cleavage/methylation domain-containing protein